MIKTYTHRPDECFAIMDSPVIHYEIIHFCEAHHIPILIQTRKRGYAKVFPYIVWNRDIMSGDSSYNRTILSLEEFKEKFRTIKEINTEIIYSIF